MDSAENIPSSPPKIEVFSLLLFIRQNDYNVDLIPCVKCDFTSYNKSRNFKNFTNSEKYFFGVADTAYSSSTIKEIHG